MVLGEALNFDRPQSLAGGVTLMTTGSAVAPWPAVMSTFAELGMVPIGVELNG